MGKFPFKLEVHFTFANKELRPDVLHTLHCVVSRVLRHDSYYTNRKKNEIRKVIDSEHYFNTTIKELTRGKRLHIGKLNSG